MVLTRESAKLCSAGGWDCCARVIAARSEKPFAVSCLPSGVFTSVTASEKARTMSPSSSRMLCWLYVSPAMKRSEEHTSELQSRLHLVCRLLLEKKKKKEKQILELIFRMTQQSTRRV